MFDLQNAKAIDPPHHPVGQGILDGYHKYVEKLLQSFSSINAWVEETQAAALVEEGISSSHPLPELGVGTILLPTAGELHEGVAWFFDRQQHNGCECVEDFFCVDEILAADESGDYERADFIRALPDLLPLQIDVLIEADKRASDLRKLVRESFYFYHRVWSFPATESYLN